LRAHGSLGAVAGRADVEGDLSFGADEGAAGIVGCGTRGYALRCTGSCVDTGGGSG